MTQEVSQTSPFIVPSQQHEVEQDALLRSGELFDGLGRRRIIHPDHVGSEKPKLVSYSRVTTFIKALDDTSSLERWRTRLTLEGLAELGFEAEYSAALAAATDEQGELDEKEYRKGLSDMAARAFAAGGGHEAADYGTYLHEMIERFLGPEPGSLDLEMAEETWPGIVADFNAFVNEWHIFTQAHAVRIVHQEAMLVDDRDKLSGRTDIVATLKLPTDTRAKRAIFDVKTGSIERELGLAQQLSKYAEMKLYDPATGARSPLRVRQDYGVVIHLPRGEASCVIRLVALAPGRKANSLCRRVRESRRKIPGIILDPATMEPVK